MKFVKRSNHKIATENGGDRQDEMNAHTEIVITFSFAVLRF